MIDEINLKEVREANIIIPNSIGTLTSFFYELQKIVQPDCFLEIGAFEASFSRAMKAMFPSSNVWAFEANPYNYEYYKNLNERINYLNLAVSELNGTLSFYLQDKNLSDGSEIEKIRGNNSILNRNDDTLSYKEVEIHSVTLDSFIESENITNKFFSLWIDVEGANKNIFGGLNKYLNNCFSFLIEVEEIEYWKNQWLREDLVNFLKKNNFIPILRDFDDNNQYNVVFINKKILENLNKKAKIKNLIQTYFSALNLTVTY